MSKHDKDIIKGFKEGGASNIKIHKAASKGYRTATMEIDGQEVVCRKIPTSSHLDGRGLSRKARDIVRRYAKYSTNKQVW